MSQDTFLRAIQEMKEKYGLEVKDHQKDHLKRLVTILWHSICAVDTSKTGLGKTYTTVALCHYYGFSPLVITTATMVPVWKEVLDTYKVNYIGVVSYNSISSESEKIDRPLYKKEKKFVLTSMGQKLKDRALLVFDEGQNIKNPSQKSKACIALARAIWPNEKRKSNSRIITLSASLFDKEEHAKQFCRLFGYIKKYKMYDNENSIFTPIGIAELISSSYLFNQIRTEDIVSAIGISPTTIKKLTFELLTKAIFPVITSHMSKPVTIHASHVYNGFFTMDEKMEEKYITATEELRRLVVFKDDNIYNKNYMSKIQPILKNLETSKLGIIKRLVAKELEDDKKKVIVCVNFLDSIAFIQDNFNKYDYLVLDGSVPAKKRQSIIDLFNNNKKYRLLICTPATGGVGVSLHDVKGNSPRVMFIVPTYDMIKILQAAGRIDREGKKSDTVVYIVYGLTKNKVTEKRIMDALARKSQVLKTINTSDDILPGDFPIYTEGEKISSE